MRTHTSWQKDRCTAIFIYNEETFRCHDVVINNNASLTVAQLDQQRKVHSHFIAYLGKEPLLRKTDVCCGLRPSDEPTGRSWNEHLTDFLSKLFVSDLN